MNFVGVDKDPIPVSQRAGLILWQTHVRRIDENAVAAAILEKVSPVREMNHRVPAGNEAVGQHPVIPLQPAD
jgi:hypothetical protein